MKSKYKVKGKKRYYCGKLGHFAKDYYKKQNDLKEKKISEGNNVIPYDKQNVNYGLVLVNVERNLNQEWILDSGCSFHICPNKNYFLDLEQTKGGQVIMGNNMTYKVKGTGTIKLLLKNGKILLLKSTRFVPELERNLASLGMLNDMELSATVLDDKNNLAKLWHCRLGHIGLKGLKALHNKGVFGKLNIGDLSNCEQCLGEAVKTATYLINQSPTSALNYDVPESVWTQKPVTYSYLKTFGCAAFTHQNIGKLEPRSVKCVFLGYAENVKGYRLWVYGEKGYRVIIRRDVVFNESYMPCLEGKKGNLTENDVQIEVEPTKIDDISSAPLETECTEADQNENEPDLTESDQGDDLIPPLDEYQLTTDRDRRQIRPPARFNSDDFVSLFTYQEDIESEPSS
ncbi:uncharacterized protein LOC111372852 [Olea europaea var. sylvestris]|uniref:uncharacterized protein LOC111372852 n=1 Tax=Olea europaea var. sylvestris TaxID=158386 RepID=UPI000C1CDEB2|nr:uncharacterized protein LOC111372852 [Olea europaea var. sylvestris]